MKIQHFILSILMPGLLLLSFKDIGSPKSNKLAISEHLSTEISRRPKSNFYQGSYDEFLREAKKQKKAILLDFWATWCGPCKKMDSETFADEKFSQYLNDNFMTFKVNIDTFDGMEIADRFAVDAFPTLIMLDNKGKYINRLRGFFPPNYLINELQKNKDLKGKRFSMPKERIVMQ
jgi:thioredoxin 1